MIASDASMSAKSLMKKLKLFFQVVVSTVAMRSTGGRPTHPSGVNQWLTTPQGWADRSAPPIHPY